MESVGDIHTRHRKEQRDLQSRITAKKKNASKKTRKGVNAECEALEKQLKDKQEQELRSLNSDLEQIDVVEQNEGDQEDQNGTAGKENEEIAGVTEQLDSSTISEPPPTIHADESGSQPRKRNRQKERLARRAAETEAAIEAAKEEAANQPDQRAVEKERIQAEFEKEGLQEKLIRPDGHCLFSAVADQLEQVGVSLGGQEGEEGYKTVRRKAAGYMQEHPEDFTAWLEEPLEGYVRKIRDTAEWGGHLELLALARTYNVEICVIQDGARQKIEPEEVATKSKCIWLAYYRHGFGLGEHYNSLRRAS